MEKISMSSLTLALSLLVTQSALAADVSPAKATELSLHRVERLVVLKKVEDGFLNLVSNLKTELITHAVSSDPGFKTTVFQQAGADGTQKGLEIVLTGDGKPVSFTVLTTGTAPAAPHAWTDADPTTLLENSLHYVLENNAANPDLVPFDLGTDSVTLTLGTNPSGQAAAVVHYHSSTSAKSLTEYLNLDGTFESFLLQ